MCRYRQLRKSCLWVGALTFMAGATSLSAGTQATFYVSPSGNDANSGASKLAAFASLEKARNVIRTVNATMTGDIVVDVAKGDYLAADTINFTEKDSGNNGFDVIYRSQDGIGAARFIGGTKVSGWTAHKDNICQINLGPGLGFTTLYENGIRADMARWPKRTSPFATSRAGYMTLIDTKDGLHYQDTAPSPDGKPFDPTGMDFSSAWAYFWDGGDGHRWCTATSAVKTVTDGTISMQRGGMGGVPDSFLIEGSLGLLTRPGEFFYDKEGGILYYASRFPGAIEKQEIIAPRVVRLVDVSGSSETTPVHNIRFSGLVFMGTDRIPQSGLSDWTDSQQSSWDAAIYLKNADHITVDSCKIAATGVCAITADSNTDTCVISRCLIENTGYHGISLINGSNHTVSNCLIRSIGELRGHGDGVSIMYDPNRPDGKSEAGTFCKHTLSHLEIYDVARAGVAVRGKGDTIEYVKVHGCVQDSGDQGAFYLVDPALNTTFNQCTSFHNYADLSCMDRPPTAVYNDRDATNTVWSNIDAGDSQMFVFRHDPQKTGTLTFDNVSWDPTCNPRKNEVAKPVNPAFDKSKMEYGKIGLTADFPAPYNDLAAAPVAPLNLWSQAGNRQATLNWTEVDRAVTYRIRRATTAGGPYTVVGTKAAPETGWDLGTSFRDTGLSNGTTYYYVVTASNQNGESPTSLEQKVQPTEIGANKLTGTAMGEGGDFAKALDGDLTTYFESQNGWVGLDFGQPKIITEIRYAPRSDNTDTTARLCQGEFQGANDASFVNAVTLYKVLGTKGGAGTPVLIPQTTFNTTPFRFVRYLGPAGKSTIAEVEFYGHSVSSDAP